MSKEPDKGIPISIQEDQQPPEHIINVIRIPKIGSDFLRLPYPKPIMTIQQSLVSVAKKLTNH